MSDQQKAEPYGKVALKRFPGLEIRLDTPKGRGVFATTAIPSGTIIDISPVLLLSKTDNDLISQSSLYHYSYNWPTTTSTDSKTTQQHQAIVFGLGSLFNHSTSSQNISWTRDLTAQVVVYRALVDISAGEELCISYGSKLWFTDADADANESASENAEEVLGNIQIDLDD